MKVLIYSNDFAPSMGGVEALVMSLARGLSAAQEGGATVTVVTRTPAAAFDDRALPFGVVRKPGLRRLAALMREADVVHLAGPAFLPLLLGQWLEKPVVVEHHGFQAACPNGQMFYEPSALPCPGHFRAGRHMECLRCNAGAGDIRSFRLWLMTFPRRWLCSRVDANIMPTEWLTGILELPRPATIAHGVATNSTANPESKPAPVFAFVGRLVSSKGATVLLEAAALLAKKKLEFKILILGDGPERARLEDFARKAELGDRVRFFGAVSPQEMEGILSGVTAVVQPSLGGEVFGLAVAENMAQGRAVIVSDLGSLAEVAGEAGLTFPAGDAAALAERMEEILRWPERARKLGAAAARRSRERFALARMIKQHLETYRRVILERGHSC